MKVLPHTSLVDGISDDDQTERVRSIVDLLHISERDDFRALRERIVVQGRTEYPTEALKVVEKIENGIGPTTPSQES